jgi:hypothetical protein
MRFQLAKIRLNSLLAAGERCSGRTIRPGHFSQKPELPVKLGLVDSLRFKG